MVQTRTGLFCIVNIMVADDMATQEVRASIAIVLPYSSQFQQQEDNILCVSLPFLKCAHYNSSTTGNI